MILLLDEPSKLFALEGTVRPHMPQSSKDLRTLYTPMAATAALAKCPESRLLDVSCGLGPSH